ncbi:MAG TPA: hypothetical protein VHO06_26840 [Polyangia bacterium]|nr:hypothetical protein [Polyangia bacterium]
MHVSGKTPSAILRYFAISDATFSVPDLMQLLRDAFGISYESTQCIGGWWHDGTGELSDAQLDAFLKPAIARASGT